MDNASACFVQGTDARMSSQVVVEADLPRIEVQTPADGLMVVRLRHGFRDQDLAPYFQRTSEVATSGLYAAMVVCDRRMPLVTPTQAARQAAWIRDHYDFIQRNCGGVALVLPNAFVRGAVRAVLSMAPMPCEIRDFKDEHEAMQWTVRALAGKRAAVHGPSWRKD